MTRSLILVLVLVWSVRPYPAAAQGAREDYLRANSLRERTANKVFPLAVNPQWSDDSRLAWYIRQTATGRELQCVDLPEGVVRPAFDHAQLASELSKMCQKPVTPDRLPLDSIRFETKTEVRFNFDGKNWSYEADTGILKEFVEDTPPRERNRRRPPRDEARGTPTPDGTWVAFIRDHNVILRNPGTSEEVSLTTDGTEQDGYLPRFYWSPDSTRLVALRRKQGEERRVYLIESSPRDQLQPKLDSYDYNKPGDRIDVTQPRLFDVPNRREITVSTELFDNPWSLDRYEWSPDSRQFTFLYNQRGHQVLRVLSLSAVDGTVSTLAEETSPTFIDYAFKTYLHRLPASSEIIWMSERSGWNHLYLFDMTTGDLKNAMTSGDWVVREVVQVDEGRRQIWFRALGRDPAQDPYHEHLCRVDFDGRNLVQLTAGDGNHNVQLSPDGSYLIDTWSRVDHPPVTELRSGVSGELIRELERADWSPLLETGWQIPERFVAKGRDGVTEIHGVIYRPTNFDPARKYPVIEKIYAGPHGFFVPKEFRAYHSLQSIGELGFIMVQIDGMGTNWRSRAFHDVCWKNLRDSGFPDRILWIREAAQKYPQIDLERVGIYGGSAGGQSTLAGMLHYPEFYQVGVADCGCHDNRMDKIWWNEAWMGWPVDDSYAENSNVTHAHRLQGKLFLTVGELDRNVDPASTMQVVDALIRADKDFDLLVVPGGGHGVGESPYAHRRRQDFFVRHLLNVEPRWQPMEQAHVSGSR